MPTYGSAMVRARAAACCTIPITTSTTIASVGVALLGAPGGQTARGLRHAGCSRSGCMNSSPTTTRAVCARTS